MGGARALQCNALSLCHCMGMCMSVNRQGARHWLARAEAACTDRRRCVQVTSIHERSHMPMHTHGAAAPKPHLQLLAQGDFLILLATQRRAQLCVRGRIWQPLHLEQMECAAALG